MNGGKQLEAEFVQYRAMRQEIAALRRQRAALYVTDTVRASASEHPYLAHTVAIAGKDQRLTRRIDAVSYTHLDVYKRQGGMGQAGGPKRSARIMGKYPISQGGTKKCAY